MSPGDQNMKTGQDGLGTAENVSGREKLENGKGRPQYRQKRVRARKTRKRDPTTSAPPKTCPGMQNMKTGPDDLGNAQNVSERAKLENGIGRHRYRQK